jgi:hypothetical protein
MATPTAVAQNEVTAAGGTGTGTTLDTNLASRQMVIVYNNGPEVLTVVLSTGAAPAVTPGVGVNIAPNGGSEVFWAGPGIRLYGRAQATLQVSGAATVCAEFA